MPKVIIYAPQDSGKTINAQALLRHFNCSALIDNWGIDSPVLANCLALTNDDSVFDRADKTNLYHLDDVLRDFQYNAVTVNSISPRRNTNLIMKDHNKKPGTPTKNIDLLCQEDSYINQGKAAVKTLLVAIFVFGLFIGFKSADADNDPLHNLVSAELISYMSDNPDQKITLYDVE